MREQCIQTVHPGTQLAPRGPRLYLLGAVNCAAVGRIENGEPGRKHHVGWTLGHAWDGH